MGKINRQALFVEESEGFRIPLEPKAGDRVKLRFRTAKDNVESVYFISGEERNPMTKVCSAGRFDYYEIETKVGTDTIYYYFEIRSDEERLFYNKLSITNNLQDSYAFRIIPGFATPDWAKGAVMYQIYVDRFCNGDPTNDVLTGEYSYIHQQVEQVKDSESDFKVVFTVTQTISDGTKKDSVTSVYETTVHKDSDGNMVITQNPTITAKQGKSDYEPQRAEPNGTVSSTDTADITDFLNTFFALYPTATEKELTYYVSGNSMPPIKCADYVFSQLDDLVLRKDGDKVSATVFVEYLDSATQMTEISQFELALKLADGNWKIVG